MATNTYYSPFFPAVETPGAKGTTIAAVPSPVVDAIQDDLGSVQTAVGKLDQQGYLDNVAPDQVMGVSLNSTIAFDVGGEQIVTLVATWNKSAASDLRSYDLQIKENSGNYVLFSTSRDVTNSFTQSYQWTVRPNQTFSVQVRAVDKAGNLGNWSATATVTSAKDAIAPAAATAFTVEATFQNAILRWTSPADTDLAYVEVWEGTTNAIGAATRIANVNSAPSLPNTYIRNGLASGATRFYWIRPVDTSNNQAGFTGPVSVTTAGVLDINDFTPGISPIKTVATLPAAAGYVGPQVLFNQADGKLYRYVNNLWVKAVDGGDLTPATVTSTSLVDGSVTTDKIASASLDVSKFTPTVRPVETFAVLPTTGNFEGRQVYNSTDKKLYRYDATAAKFITSVATTDLTGTIVNAQVAAGAIDASKFTADTKPVEVVTSLPTTGNSAGRTVFLTTDGKLYRYVGTAFTSAIPTTDLSGTVSSGQIADAAITVAKIQDATLTAAKFNSTVKPIEVVSALPTTGNVAGRTVFLTTDNKLYRYNGTAFTSAVATGDLTGTIINSQIADTAVTTAKLADLAITNAKVADAVLTGSKLVDGAISAVKIADGAVSNLKIAGQSIDLSKFATGLRPIETVSTLPAAGTAGRTVFLTTDSKLYRDTGSAWTASVPTADLAGTISTTQIGDSVITAAKIAAATIDATKFVSTVKPIEVVSALPAAGTAGRTVFLSTDSQLYRDTGTGWTTAVPTASLTGTVASGQIADLAILSTKLADNAVTQTKLLDNIVSNAKIVDGAISAAKIAANTITANQIASGTITGTQISAGTITANEIATGAITAAKIATGAITIGSNGALGGAGSGTVTITGLGYTGALNATNGAPSGTLVGSTLAQTLDSRVTSGLTYADTRNDNQPPSYYYALRSTTPTVAEFKTLSVIGIASGGTYGQMVTTVQWGDASGGPVQQEVRDSLGRYWNRVSTSTTAWGAWSDTGAQINAGVTTIVGGKITTGTVTALQMAARTITANEIASGTISANEIAANTITATQIASGTITATQIAGRTISAGNLVAGTITGNEIAAETIGANKIQAATITGDRIAANTLTAAQIAAGTITAAQIAANTITAGQIAAGAISADRLQIGATKFDRLTVAGSNYNVTNTPGAVTINGAVNLLGNRGHTVSVYDRYTHVGKALVVFDTYASDDVKTNMANYLNSLNGDVIVAITTSDACGYNAALRAALKRCGCSTNVDGTADFGRQSGSIIGVPGIGEGNGQEAFQPLDSPFTSTITSIWIDGDLTGLGAGLSALTKLTSTYIADGAITTGKIFAGAISTDKLGANAVTAAKIAAGTITSNEIAARTITAGNLVAGSITANEIASETIGANKITAGTITGDRIAGSTITALQIASGTITANQIAAGTLSANLLVASTRPFVAATLNMRLEGGVLKWDSSGVTYQNSSGATIVRTIAAGSVNGGQGIVRLYYYVNDAGTNTNLDARINNSFELEGNPNYKLIATWNGDSNVVVHAGVGTIINGDHIVTGSITATQIAASTITANQIAAGTITAGQIATGTITATQIAATTITAAKIAGGTITATQMAADSITATQLAANAVVARNITAGIITSGMIAADTITAGNIAANAVTSSELAANAVTAGKILAGTVTATEIASRTISADRIATGAITANEIAATTITAAKIATGTITATQIAGNTITANQIAAGTITAAQIAAGTITANQIAANTISSSRMLITDSTNFAENPDFSMGSVGWTLQTNAGGSPYITLSNDSYQGGWLGAVGANSNGGFRNNGWMRVTTGDQLYGTIIAKGGTSSMYPRISYLNSNGTEIAVDGGASFVANGSYQRMGVAGTVPSGAMYARIEAFYNTGANGFAYLGYASLMRKQTGELIVDGVITASKIATGAITTDKLLANSITTNKLTIASRPVSTVLLDIRADNDGVLRWNNGYIQYVRDDGSYGSDYIPGGSANFPGQTLYVYYQPGRGQLDYSPNEAGVLNNAFYLHLATWMGGSNLTVKAGVATLLSGDRIVTGSIVAGKIAANTITAAQIAGGTITADQIAAGTITSAQIAANTITARQLAIGSGDNVIPDGNYNDTAWQGFGDLNGAYVFATTSPWTVFRRALRIPASRFTYRGSPFFAVEPGATYKVRVQTYIPSNFSGYFTPSIHVPGVTYLSLKSGAGADGNNPDQAGSHAWTAPNYNGSTVDVREFIVENPPGYDRGQWQLRYDGNFTGDSVEIAMSIVRVSDTTLIKDGAITTNKITVGSLNGDRLTANTVDAATIRAGTVISNLVQIANTGLGAGFDLGAVALAANNPANRVNQGTTTIAPGLVSIGGAGTLNNWRMGGDKTTINGGAIEANTIKANQISVGARAINMESIDFQVQMINGYQELTWTPGYIQYMADNGSGTSSYIAGGSTYGTPKRCFIYWTKAAGTLSLSQNAESIMANPDAVIIGTYSGGTQFSLYYGGTIIDGDRITTNSIKANKLQVDSLSAISGVIGLLRTATTGARMEIESNQQRGYFANNQLAFRMGVW